MSTRLVTWLRAQLDWQEDIATRAKEADEAAGRLFEGHCSPHWTLAEVAAKRAIIGIHDPGNTTKTRGWCDYCRDPGKPGFMAKMPCHHLRLLALPYANRHGYRPEWAPPKEEQ